MYVPISKYIEHCQRGDRNNLTGLVIGNSSDRKLNAAAKRTALPGSVFFSLVAVKIPLGRGGQTIEHSFDKNGKRAFSPAVFLAENIDAVLKVDRKAAELSKIFNFDPQ